MKEPLSEKITKCLITESWFVYKHTSPTGKVYIGITRKLPRERWGRGEGYKENLEFYSDIQKLGWDAFTHEIIDRGLTEQQALDKEDRLIREHDCIFPKGYNRRHNRSGQGTEADLSDVEIYAAAKEKTIKNNMFKFYKEYLLFLQPSLPPVKYLEKKVPLPKPANRAVHSYFPKWLEEICVENRQEIEEITANVEQYKKWVEDFYQKKKKYITMAGDAVWGTVFTVDDAAYYEETVEQLIENFKENKSCADLLYTLLKRAKEEDIFSQLIEVEMNQSMYKEFENSFVWEAKITTQPMPLLREKICGEKYFMADLCQKNIYISLFAEEIFCREKSRLTFRLKEKMAENVLEILDELDAVEMPELIYSFSVADASQYDAKAKEKIHYRLQNFLRKMKQENPRQYNFMKKKMNIYYRLYEMKLSDLEEKLEGVENICSHKQEKFISFLVAEFGLKVKSYAFFTKAEVQFLIPNLQKGNTEVLEKFENYFDEI